jgi:hypothetical protein
MKELHAFYGGAMHFLSPSLERGLGGQFLITAYSWFRNITHFEKKIMVDGYLEFYRQVTTHSCQ